jgi:predicted acyl esterase
MNANRQSDIITVGKTRVANVYGVPKDAQIVFERNVPAPMRDGVSLSTNVYRPAAPGRFPVVLHMSPQGKDRLPITSSTPAGVTTRIYWFPLFLCESGMTGTSKWES